MYKSGNDDIVFDTKKNEKKITNSQVLLQAFAAYAAVLVSRWPNHAPELYQYMGDILNLAHLHNFELVMNYDVAFHYKIQDNVEKSWALIDNILILREIISPAMSITRAYKQENKSFNRNKPREVC